MGQITIRLTMLNDNDLYHDTAIQPFRTQSVRVFFGLLLIVYSTTRKMDEWVLTLFPPVLLGHADGLSSSVLLGDKLPDSNNTVSNVPCRVVSFIFLGTTTAQMNRWISCVVQ